MLSNSLPEYIETEKRKYKLNTDYRKALQCYEVIEDASIDDYERALAIIYILLGDIPFDDNLDEVNKLLRKYLQCGEEYDEEAPTAVRDMDLLHDEKYIVASFMSDYRIDLSRIDYIHWWQFNTLLQGLTNECILNRVREIRTMDLKDFKGKAKERMAKAKQQLALPPRKNVLSDEENEALDRFDALLAQNKAISSHLTSETQKDG